MKNFSDYINESKKYEEFNLWQGIKGTIVPSLYNLSKPFRKNINHDFEYSDDNIDPFGEDQWYEPDGTFLTWLKINYPNEKLWKNIKEIRCWGNNGPNARLYTLDGIENLINLERLYCQDNQLTNLKGIENLDLKYLYCDNNKLTTLNEINSKVNLLKLNCSSCKLTNLNLDNLVNLKSLYCNNNELTNLDLNNLTNLEVLYCDNNKLTKIDGIDKFAKFDEFYFFNNNFAKKYEKTLRKKINRKTYNYNREKQYKYKKIDD